MSSTGFLSSLNIGTLLIVFVIVALGFLFFLRRRSNRAPMDHRQERNVARDLDDGRKAPDHSPHD